MLCGARGFEAIAQWIHVQEPEFHHLLGYTRRPPTKNAFRDLLAILDAELFEQVLVDWTTTVWHQADLQPFVSTTLPVESIDGKVLCGAIAEHGRAICLLTRVDQATGRV
ncbi:MAG: transposase family protein [Planctomycetaceae bacterium]